MCIQECVSEFISFITSQCCDKCILEKRKTINGEDVLWSMNILGFENYAETLKIYLAKYREFEMEAVTQRERLQEKSYKSYKTEFEPKMEIVEKKAQNIGMLLSDEVVLGLEESSDDMLNSDELLNSDEILDSEEFDQSEDEVELSTT